MIEASVWI